MIYEPGNVTINEINLTGAYKFDGLIDFHGLLSQATLVLDPSE
jgi:hypothetical protein